jgi:HSP20 family protein
MSKSGTALAPEKASSMTPATPARSPFELMRSFGQEMDRLFDDFGFGRRWPLITRAFAPEDALWSPNIEVVDNDGKMTVRADLPGLAKDEIKVELTDTALTIEGERKHTEEKKEDGYYRSECSYGHFYRSIPLPEGAKAESAKANFVNGVLQITVDVPTRNAPAARRLTIDEAPKS